MLFLSILTEITVVLTTLVTAVFVDSSLNNCVVLTNLNNCVAFVNRVGVFLEHVHKTLKTSKRFTSNFSVVSLYTGCLLALVASTTTAATFT